MTAMRRTLPDFSIPLEERALGWWIQLREADPNLFENHRAQVIASREAER